MDYPNYATTGFQMYQVDLLSGIWKEINSLGNRAPHLGHSASISLEVLFNKLALESNPIVFILLAIVGKHIKVVQYSRQMLAGIIEPFYHDPSAQLYFPHPFGLQFFSYVVVLPSTFIYAIIVFFFFGYFLSQLLLSFSSLVIFFHSQVSI